MSPAKKRAGVTLGTAAPLHARRSRLGRIARPEDHVIVLFGATGDLARRKLLPGLYHLAVAGLMPRRFQVIGSAPAEFAMTDKAFVEHARRAVAEFGSTKPTGRAWSEFAQRLSFGAADLDDASGLIEALKRAESSFPAPPHRLYHLAVPPSASASVIEMLGDTGLCERARVVCEKPFGVDLSSARALNEEIHKVFAEADIFRIDHFLGKESVDNLLALRFANGLFEPVWNRDHVSHVQIDVPETLTIEGRASFYEATGAFKDMVVTHLFQVLGFVAMEPITKLSAKALLDEKIRVFDALKPIDPAHVVRGQYEGYRDEPGVSKRSKTETFVALKVEIDNWRWAGVPFYLRTGKSMAVSRQVITIGFRTPALKMFDLDARVRHDGRGNELAIDFGDPGQITARFLAKVPGPEMRLGEADMTFRYADSFAGANNLEGYERLIHDAMVGDQSLFTRSDSIERLWEIATPLLEHPPPIERYAKGSYGPKSAEHLIAPHRWHLRDDS